jgi:protein-disulfide isomerase
MRLSRRSTLAGAAGAAALGAVSYLGWRRLTPGSPPIVPALPRAAAHAAPADDQHRAERTLGDAAAKVTVIEFFSLTCTHCATFARTTMPDVERDLISPGKVRFVYHDFPLDQVALTAAMVARYLPPAQYYPFISALFANQDRWAFARGINTTDEIWKLAALAGMSRATFDQAIADTGLRNWLLEQQQADQSRWKIDATPSFVINGQKYSGEMSYDAFRKLLPDV